MDISAWATMVSALIAAVALMFAGWQVLLLNRQAAYDRRVAYEGVVVSWRPEHAPAEADADGAAEWEYLITAHNPGRLPIDEVKVRMVFPGDVRRIRYTGTLDPPTRELILVTPVVAGGTSQSWNRRLQIDFSLHGELRHTYAEISYVDIDGKDHRNRWPRRPSYRDEIEDSPSRAG